MKVFWQPTTMRLFPRNATWLKDSVVSFQPGKEMSLVGRDFVPKLFYPFTDSLSLPQPLLPPPILSPTLLNLPILTPPPFPITRAAEILLIGLHQTKIVCQVRNKIFQKHLKYTTTTIIPLYTVTTTKTVTTTTTIHQGRTS